MVPIKTLTVLKNDNFINELCIAYGLLSILNEYSIDVRLKNYKSALIIEIYEEVNYEELFVIQMEKEKDIRQTLTSGMTSKNDFEIMMKKMFGEDGEGGFFGNQENVVNLFMYYETLDESYLNTFSSTSMVYVGSAYATKGQRGYKGPKNPTVLEHVRWLASLGYFRATTYVEINKKKELTWLPVPSKFGIKELIRFDFYTYKDKEDGTIRPLGRLSDESLSVGLAKILLSIQEKMLQNQIIDEYEGVLMLTTLPAGQRPLNDKNQWYKLIDLNLETIEKLKQIINDKNREFDVKESAGKMVTERTLQSFKLFSKNLSKFESQLPFKSLEKQHTKELSHMFSQTELFENKGVQRIAYGLSMLMSKKKGYNLQVGLMNAVTSSQLFKVINKLVFTYQRTMPRNAILLNDGHIKDVLDLIDEKNYGASEVANMILLLSNTYMKTDKKPDDLIEETDVNQDL